MRGIRNVRLPTANAGINWGPTVLIKGARTLVVLPLANRKLDCGRVPQRSSDHNIGYRLLRSTICCTPRLPSSLQRSPRKVVDATRRSCSMDAGEVFEDIHPTAAYVHLPFCKRRCHYCDFAIIATGRDGKQDHVLAAMEAYVDTVCKEIESTPVAGGKLHSVFFGGGTPSLLPPALLGRVLAALRLRFGLREDAEISIEVGP
ncbi:hypothetical protein CYMTET_47041, partial [Cymbomonas tetramitiformis]